MPRVDRIRMPQKGDRPELKIIRIDGLPLLVQCGPVKEAVGVRGRLLRFALGLDRLAMILGGGASVRDAIAFPKTLRGYCPLTEAPSPLKEEQLTDLGLTLRAKPKEIEPL